MISLPRVATGTLRFSLAVVICSCFSSFLASSCTVLPLFAGEISPSFPALSKSIVTEAQSQSTSLQPSAAGAALTQVLTSTVTNGSKVHADGRMTSQAQFSTPYITGLLPSIPVTLSEGALNATLSPDATSLHYHGNRTTASVILGLGYLKEQNTSTTFGGKADMATLLFDNLAIGTGFNHSVNRNDLIVNGVWQIPNSGLRFKATGGYLWGNQNFIFPSGSANINLEQFSYLFSTQFIIPKTDEATSLHSIGFSFWGAKANQLSNADGPRLYLQDTGTEYLIMNDPLTLSEGRLFGASSDIQFALRSNMVVKGSVGYEQLRFPFADGTSERHNKAYYSIDLNYEPLKSLTIGGGYKSGAGEQRTSLMAGIGNWSLGAFMNNGQNGVSDNRGVMLTYNIAISKQNQQLNLARRMQPYRGNDRSTMLADAITRPVQIPLTFLAKVDLTAVSRMGTATRASAMTFTVLAPVTSFTPLTVTGGTTPYTYFVSTGTLPAGLVLNASTGAVTGTPTTAQSAASVTFSARDANNNIFGTSSTIIFTVNAAGTFNVSVSGF